MLPTSIAASADDWAIDDILLAESGSAFQLSPDASRVVWIQSKMDKEKGRSVSNLYLSTVDGANTVQLSRGKSTHSAPKWSPDGTRIAFLSDREKPAGDKAEGLAETQLWVFHVGGGEPRMVSELKRSIRAYEWKDDESFIIAAQEKADLREQTIKKDKDTSKVVEDVLNEPPVRLFSLDLENTKLAAITKNNNWIDRLFVSPDGKWALTRNGISISYQFDAKIRPLIFLTNLETGEMTELFEGSNLLLRSASWSPDSKSVYFTVAHSTHPIYTTASVSHVYHYELGEESPVQVDLDWEYSLSSSRVLAVDGGFITLLANGVHPKLARYMKKGKRWSRTLLDGDHADGIFNFDVSNDGKKIVYEHSTAITPTQWYSGRIRGNRIVHQIQITKLNESFEKKPVHRTEIVHWKGAEDEEVEGILYYPAHYVEEEKFPLILMIHGGPAGADFDRWSQNWGRPKLLLTQKDCFILEVNYHGSSNYGLDWVESIGDGKYYSLPLEDIEKGVDYIIDRGLADPDRLATMGWSNGSILSVALVTQNTRYKAISAGAGDVEWISDWGNVDFGAQFDNYYFGGSPWDNLDWYIENSPFFKMDQVVTPTIIYFGTKDRSVPPSQGWSHFRALQQFGNTEVKCVLFPDEPHSLKQYVHQRRKVEEDLRWFDKHLLNNTPDTNPSLKPGTLLASAITLNGAAKTNGNFGVLHEGKLIPEVVDVKGLHIGRFEVTRAQYAEFDSSRRVAPGKGNFPANGIDFKSSKEYAAWLTQTTGQSYRIANVNEVESLYEKAKSGNTLDYWAGYSPNPEDLKRLKSAIATLEGSAPLLTKVGSIALDDDTPPLFDLKGNVAEWAIGKDGVGKLMGGAAIMPEESTDDDVLIPMEYQGLRVVRRSE
jgi:dipeptidyl aminopeptidase/acylaminoacyl peptidase